MKTPFLHSRPARIVLAGVAAAVVLTACSSASTSSAPSSSTASQPTSGATASPAASASGTAPVLASKDGRLDVTLTAAESQVPFRDGTRWAMTYNGQVTGPTLVIHPGDHVNVTVKNDLTVPTSLHTHGLHVDPAVDNPFLTIAPGESHTYSYDIPANQQAGTFWYHPHPHGEVAKQVAAGLEGAIIVESPVDEQLAEVSTDRVVVISDPALSASDPWPASTDSSSSSDGHMMGGHMMGDSGSGSGVDMMTAMMGRSGPVLLANGQEGLTWSDANGKLERVHLVNGTASTRLRLEWTGASMLQLATEGARLESAATVTSVDLPPGSRTELVLIPGSSGGQLTAQRISGEGGGGNVGHPEVLATVSGNAGTDASMLPASLNTVQRDLFAPDVKVAKTRTITLDGHMNPTIDGKPFDPNTVNFTAKKGTVEEWVITSHSPMDHPIHLHTWPFQIKGEPGWHDIVTVPANETRVIRVAYDDFGGTTVIHCHVLDHEDTGMMAVIRVR